jgi:hypothetical protein
MKIGYKGFDKDLKCRDASKPEKDNPKLCSADGFHYCNKLVDVFNHYGLNDKNRFCEIEILGKFTDDSDKSITTSLRVIREISKAEILELQADESMKLDEVRKLQTRYPLLHVGGSIGLFLHGVRLKRWNDGSVDIDVVAPYFQLFESFDDTDIEYLDCKKSGNDFDEAFVMNSVKVDCRIDPHQRYEIIEYKGFKYKVSKFETIMAAKMKYAVNGQDKHKQDIREMCGVKDKVKTYSLDENLSF